MADVDSAPALMAGALFPRSLLPEKLGGWLA